MMKIKPLRLILSSICTFITFAGIGMFIILSTIYAETALLTLEIVVLSVVSWFLTRFFYTKLFKDIEQ